MEGWNEEESFWKGMELRGDTIRKRDAWRESNTAWIEYMDQHYSLLKAKRQDTK